MDTGAQVPAAKDVGVGASTVGALEFELTGVATTGGGVGATANAGADVAS